MNDNNMPSSVEEFIKLIETDRIYAKELTWDANFIRSIVEQLTVKHFLRIVELDREIASDLLEHDMVQNRLCKIITIEEFIILIEKFKNSTVLAAIFLKNNALHKTFSSKLTAAHFLKIYEADSNFAFFLTQEVKVTPKLAEVLSAQQFVHFAKGLAYIPYILILNPEIAVEIAKKFRAADLIELLKINKRLGVEFINKEIPALEALIETENLAIQNPELFDFYLAKLTDITNAYGLLPVENYCSKVLQKLGNSIIKTYSNQFPSPSSAEAPYVEEEIGKLSVQALHNIVIKPSKRLCRYLALKDQLNRVMSNNCGSNLQFFSIPAKTFNDMLCTFFNGDDKPSFRNEQSRTTVFYYLKEALSEVGFQEIVESSPFSLDLKGAIKILNDYNTSQLAIIENSEAHTPLRLF